VEVDEAIDSSVGVDEATESSVEVDETMESSVEVLDTDERLRWWLNPGKGLPTAGL